MIIDFNSRKLHKDQLKLVSEVAEMARHYLGKEQLFAEIIGEEYSEVEIWEEVLEEAEDISYQLKQSRDSVLNPLIESIYQEMHDRLSLARMQSEFSHTPTQRPDKTGA